MSVPSCCAHGHCPQQVGRYLHIARVSCTPSMGCTPSERLDGRLAGETGRQVFPEEAPPLFSGALASECGREVLDMPKA